DFRRMPGAFNATMATLRRLHQHGVTFVINMTLHEKNLNDAEEMLLIAEEVGATRVVFVPIYAVGRAASKATECYFPQTSALRATVDKILEIAKTSRGPEVIVGDPTEKELF